MKAITATVVAIALAATGGIAHAGQYVDGNKLVGWLNAVDRMERNASTGSDMLSIGQLQGFLMSFSDSYDGTIYCAPQAATLGQLTAVVKRYVNGHPEQWTYSATLLTMGALSTAFPCKK
jgi:hypothetical protein